MADFPEVQLARLEEQMKSLFREMERQEAARARNYERVDTLLVSVESIDRRLNEVERQMTSNAPTIEEFITIKHRVKGAGIAGKWIWAIGGALIGIVFSARGFIREFLFS